jgi:WD40 repeat protein
MLLQSSETLSAQTFANTPEMRTGISWSPNSDRLALGLVGRIDIVNASTSLVVGSLNTGHSDIVLAVAWSPNGQYIAASSEYHRELLIWDVSSGVFQNQLPSMSLIGGNDFSLYHLTWSPNSQRIGGISFDDALLQVWDVTTSAVTLVLRGIQNGLDWFGNYLAVGVGDGVSVYDSNTGQYLSDIGRHPAQVNVIRWSPDGTRIATTSTDNTVRIWSANPLPIGISIDNLTPLRTIMASQDMVSSIAWSPDGLMIASSGYTGNIAVWNTGGDNFSPLRTINAGVPTRNIAWNNSGTQIAYLVDTVPNTSSVQIITPPSAQPFTPPTPTVTTATPTAAPSPAASPSLREVFNAPTCAVSCWQGIEPGVTTQSQLDELLSTNNISPTVLSLGNSVYLYSWFLNTEDPYIDTQGGIFPIQTIIGLGLVNQISVPVNISLTQVIAEYGSPALTYEAIINGNTPSNNYRTLDIVYPSRGITFLITSDINAGNISQVRVSGSADISSIYVGQPSTISDCNFYGESGCSLATATPTATP